MSSFIKKVREFFNLESIFTTTAVLWLMCLIAFLGMTHMDIKNLYVNDRLIAYNHSEDIKSQKKLLANETWERKWENKELKKKFKKDMTILMQGLRQSFNQKLAKQKEEFKKQLAEAQKNMPPHRETVPHPER